MKRVVIGIAALLLVVSSSVFSQTGWRLRTVESSIGRGAFTSGFDIRVTLEDSVHNQWFNVTGNHQRVYLIYGTNWRIVTVGICAGFYKNMPQSGPYLIIAPVKFLYFLHWSGFGAGIPDRPKMEINKFYSSNGIYFTAKGFTAGCLHMEFLGETTWLPGISYVFIFNKELKFLVGADYKTADKKVPMLFRMGISYSPAG
ncbi:MAG: hypothetical protein Q7R98_02530 [Candidatus Jorgensenbacteria bacterium]|nr:hypothetical protein [Candidatus Jorgensenbacteria bacterium]